MAYINKKNEKSSSLLKLVTIIIQKILHAIDFKITLHRDTENKKTKWRKLNKAKFYFFFFLQLRDNSNANSNKNSANKTYGTNWDREI